MQAQMISRNQAVQITVLLLRIAAGTMFLQAGGMKLFGWFGGMPGAGTVSLTSQIGIGAILELVGGGAIVLGLFTRPAAFILSGEMAVAYWQFHAPNAPWPIENHGEPAVLFCFIFLFFSAFGAGQISTDALLRKKGKKKNQQAIITHNFP